MERKTILFFQFQGNDILGFKSNGSFIVTADSLSASAITLAERNANGNRIRNVAVLRPSSNRFFSGMALLEDQKILYAEFLNVTGTTIAQRIIRLMPDGTLDTSFHSPSLPFRNYIYFSNFLVQPDNKFIVEYDGKIYRINKNGSIDTSVNWGEGVNAVPYSTLDLRFDKNGKLLLRGGFIKYNNRPVSYLAKIFLNDCSLPIPGITISTNTLTATSSRPAGAYYQWYRNGWPIGAPDSTKNTLAIADTGRYSVALLKDACRAESADILVLPVGLANRLSGTSLRIIPNPSLGRVRLASSGRGRVEVLSAQGKLVYSSLKRSDEDAVIDLSQLPKGLYVVRVGQEQGRLVKE